jgi:hypothetical protein
MRLYDIITRAERSMLRTMHGSVLELRPVRERLHAAGLRYCRACDRVKPLTKFHGPYPPSTTGVHTAKVLWWQSRCRRCINGRTVLAPFIPGDAELRLARDRRNTLRSLLARADADGLLKIPVKRYASSAKSAN